MKKIIALLLSIAFISAVLFLVALEEEGVYACYMDNGDVEYCKEQEKVYTYEECVSSAMKDILEGDDAVAREWCREHFTE
tara:strand:+ start:466 stop:705 length:240 start_codon:yes stop_codon:yes gene_type:complete